MTERFTHQRYGGYEVSSKGDSRFSAFSARLEDGRSIEEHYQCDIKGYDPGGRNWRLGKGKPPINKTLILWDEYLGLWRRWAVMNKDLVLELMEKASEKGGVLSDRFASTGVNQAGALAAILNEIDGLRV